MKQIINILTVLILASFLGYSGSKKIVVDLSKQMAYAYNGKKLIYKGWISSGKRKFRTPTGKFRVLQKEKEHISNEWPDKIDPKTGKKGGAKMPYMLRISWSGIALHEGFTPNRPASHGCIRVKSDFAKKLYNWARVGTRVIVKGKAPKRVARKGKGFIDNSYYAKSKKSKRVKIAKKLTNREKLVKYYSKFSYKRINRILKKKYSKKRTILASSKSKSSKIRELRKIKWILGVLKDAKAKKHYKRAHKSSSKIVKKRFKKVKSRGSRYTLGNYNYNSKYLSSSFKIL